MNRIVTDIIKGTAKLAIYLLVLMASGYAVGRGCAAGLPIKPIGAQASASLKRELDVDQAELASNRWDWIWASAHE